MMQESKIIIQEEGKKEAQNKKYSVKITSCKFFCRKVNASLSLPPSWENSTTLLSSGTGYSLFKTPICSLFVALYKVVHERIFAVQKQGA